MGRLDTLTEDSTPSAIHHRNSRIDKQSINPRPNWVENRGNCEGIRGPDTFNQMGA